MSETLNGSTPLLRVVDVHAGYGPVRVLHGVSLEVRPGMLVTLIGANGAGKTTTLRSIVGQVKLSAGQVSFGGVDVTTWPTHQRVAHGIVMVPEGRQVFPNMTVLENLELGSHVEHARKQRSVRLREMLDLFPRLAERRRQLAGTLSGGEQQMLAIARGLMAGPRLLILDEPSLGLAPLIVDQVFDVINRIRKQGITILLVEQDAQRALEVADYGYVLEHGQIVLADSAAALANNSAVKQAYLGL